jgi:hypothetical protein
MLTSINQNPTLIINYFGHFQPRDLGAVSYQQKAEQTWQVAISSHKHDAM